MTNSGLILALPDMIARVVNKVRDDAEHQLAPSERFAFYKVLDPSVSLGVERYKHLTKSHTLSISDGNFRFGYLGILTARYVLPIWDRAMENHSIISQEDPEITPRVILNMAEGVLNGSIDPNEANGYLIEDFHHWVGNLAYDTQYSAYCVANAAYRALSIILGGSLFRLPVGINLSDDKVKAGADDVAANAVRAYSLFDSNVVENWWSSFNEQNLFQYDYQKRLKFWEWWLTEAIPQAYDITSSRGQV